MLTGRIFGAEEALRGGLVKSLHAPEDLLPEGRRLARHFVENTAPVSVAVTRRLIWQMRATGNPLEAHRRESIAVPHLVGLPDGAEGVASFMEKRPPRFTGSPSRDVPDALA